MDGRREGGREGGRERERERESETGGGREEEMYMYVQMSCSPPSLSSCIYPHRKVNQRTCW